MLIAARFTRPFSRLVTLNGRSMLAVTVAAVGLSGTSSAVLAQALPYLAQTDVNYTLSAAADIAGSPGTGPIGATGNGGGYNCNQMTWGAACAAMYSFGSYSTREGGRGYDAPSGGNAIQVINNHPDVVTATGTPTAAGSPDVINVTQLASGMQQAINSGTAPTTASVALNSGNAFDLTVTPVSGSPVTLNLPAGTTLESLRAAIAASTALSGYTASISVNTNVTPNVSVLTIVGPVGAGNNFTVATLSRDAGGALVSPTAPVTQLDFSAPTGTVIYPDASVHAAPGSTSPSCRSLDPLRSGDSRGPARTCLGLCWTHWTRTEEPCHTRNSGVS